MAGFAFEIFICVLDIPCILCYDFFMAFAAVNIGMLAFQPETGPGVVEIHRFPVLRGMARSAITDPFFHELVLVGIFVTIGAACGQSLKLLMGRAAWIFFSMACTAGLPGMSTRQSITGFVMVELDLTPG
jgi:hypothetical protein